MDNDCDLTITRLAPLIQRKELSPVELTEFCLERISRLQPEINAYITVTPEIAIAQAKRAESEIAKGHYRGVLHGIPINLKDLFFTHGIRTTAGSRILREFLPEENAAVVDSLLRAGCILLGKTNMHEFAFGSTNLQSHFGPVRNPWNTSHISGGSSGGSAASIVTAQAMASFGTDTGGSIRIPSAACGCVGFKPSYSRIPMNGIIPLSGTLDHAGPLSRCVLDAAFLFEAVTTTPILDSNPRRVARTVRSGVKNLVIGIPRQYFFNRIQSGVRELVLTAARVFEQLGADIREVHLKGMEETERLAADITGCEALAFHEKWLRTKSRNYGEDVRTRLEQSRTVTATAYIQSLGKRIAYAREFERVLETIHLLLAPTLPVTAPAMDEADVKIGRSRENVRLAMLRLTRPANLARLPAISIPCGFSDGLPVGLQLIGRYFDDYSVLRAAYAFERATPWHEHFPVVSSQ
jgi:aspartyl-tRNA(Asn)/glutamyl-tRNA(Gln) amidotransferase subunit A